VQQCDRADRGGGTDRPEWSFPCPVQGERSTDAARSGDAMWDDARPGAAQGVTSSQKVAHSWWLRPQAFFLLRHLPDALSTPRPKPALVNARPDASRRRPPARTDARPDGLPDGAVGVRAPTGGEPSMSKSSQ